jgi:uncharacterized protein YdhG (YjbR/CyaY superfamily)
MEIQARLNAVRETIRKAAPEATEKISYQIPTFHLNGNLVHFAGFKNHVGFYPGASGIAAFEEELSGYVHAKGSIQFPHDEKLPLALVRRMVKFRVGENREKARKNTGK